MAQTFEEKLQRLKNTENRRLGISGEELLAASDFCEEYKKFLNQAKTERETIKESVALAKAAGFVEYVPGTSLKPGDKIYDINRGKSMILAVIGKRPGEDGLNIIAAHTDAPHLDLKPHPLYEKNHLAYLDTHYYGGIKKYQWATIPLALHGTVITKDGRTVTLAIGEKEEDPVFCITDLQPHLSELQNQKNAAAVIEGEDLDVLSASLGLENRTETNAVKLMVLEVLEQEYGISIEDLVSAELLVVPAHKARDMGFDRSMICAYAHDDRVCVYTALQALFKVKEPEKTAIVYLTDKEEVGSDSCTGATSLYLHDVVEALFGTQKTGEIFKNSYALSADVIVGEDPLYAQNTMDPRDTGVLNGGVVLTKYRGTRGKAETQDATAEFVAALRQLFDTEKVRWQTGENGRVDRGGGRTIARFLGRLNMDTVDLGVPLLSMHAPAEVAAKIDIYAAYRAYLAFLEKFNI